MSVGLGELAFGFVYGGFLYDKNYGVTKIERVKVERENFVKVSSIPGNVKICLRGHKYKVSRGKDCFILVLLKVSLFGN